MKHVTYTRLQISTTTLRHRREREREKKTNTPPRADSLYQAVLDNTGDMVGCPGLWSSPSSGLSVSVCHPLQNHNDQDKY